MATTYYVDDGGSATAPYDTYAKAATTLAGLITGVAPFAVDDEIHIGHDHSEDAGASVTWNFANGTEAQPIRIISTNTGTDAYQAGASLAATGGAFDITIGTGASVWHGVTFTVGDEFVCNANAVHKFYGCTISATDRPLLTQPEATVAFFDCAMSSADAVAPGIRLSSECKVLVRGGSITMASANSGVAIVESPADGSEIVIEDCDLSGCTADMKLGSFVPGNNQRIVYRRSKLPSAYDPSTMVTGNNRLEVESCSDDTSANPFLGIGGDGLADAAGKYGGWESIIGKTKSVVAQHRNGGASDGVNDYSWEMNANANVSYFSPLESPPITYWAEPGSQTVTIYIANDVDLNDDECWMVVEHPDTANPANPDHIVLSNTKINPLATPSAITRDAGSTWDGAGTGTDGGAGQQKLVSSSFNPIEAGPVIIRVYLAKDDTMYVDPRPAVA